MIEPFQQRITSSSAPAWEVGVVVGGRLVGGSIRALSATLGYARGVSVLARA
jgi:hypothetical protein